MSEVIEQNHRKLVAKGYEWKPQVCPICEIAPTRRLGKRGGPAHRAGLGVECEIWRCGRCGLVFPNPMPVPTGGLAQHYEVDSDDYFQHHDRDAKSANAHTFLTQAAELCGRKGRILDIGAGRGELLRAAVEGDWEAVGIEPSAEFARYATEYSRAEVIAKSIEDCTFESTSFDVVVLGAVLEHLYNPDQIIREIARILRPGGVLFVDVPNEAGLYFRLGNIYERIRGRDWVVNLAPTFPPFHVFGFTPRSLRLLLEKHGLAPTRWRIYAGRALVPSGNNLIGNVERKAAQAVTALSRFGSLGTYIETWATKIG
jgi:SAM-dependent methyltransferase